MVAQRTFNPLGSGSNPGGPTKFFLAFVQWTGQESSKLLIGVRFLYAGPRNCPGGEIGRHSGLKTRSFRKGRAGSIPARGTKFNGAVAEPGLLQRS
jgi:hypothetical protein